MEEKRSVQPGQEDAGKWIMDLLVSLLEDQTGEKYEYQCLFTETPKYHP
ncbi:MAG: hypothetical protein HFH15_12505 [Ruminococcus sp.]|jgi:hypothetical protein|nr:hypothetical protein [Ruminococcus sp.]